jgi:carboxypeptidase T
MNWQKPLLTAVVAVFCLSALPAAVSEDHIQYWVKVSAKDSFERSLIANTGASIETIFEDYVLAFASTETLRDLQKNHQVVSAIPALSAFDFPQADQNYHTYVELEDALFNLAGQYPNIAKLVSLGRTTEGRTIWNLRISGDMATASQRPGVFYVGGHHAREHLSVEVPLMFAEHLLKNYATDARIKKLVDSRDIHIVPALNADGLEFDIATGTYQYWRKNRRDNKDRTYGVDLNRNYGYQWGTGGSSKRTNDETYMGTSAFSEPETQAVKAFIEKNVNINIVLSFHTFSELILYPWGHKNGPMEPTDQRVHEKLANAMAKWNGYKPQPSSDLYIASGDLTDWTYGAHKIVSFTFELDPKGGFSRDGFYPGAAIIPAVFKKNLEPALYLLEYADDPRRVLQ